jgi:hypothetical protein
MGKAIEKSILSGGSLIVSNRARNILLIPVLAIGHVFYDLGVGNWLFGIAGGIREYPNRRWTEFGGIDYAFETPLYVPGSYLMAANNVAPCAWKGGIWDLLLLVAATILTAIATGQLIQRIVNKDRNKLGKYNWRLIVIFLGWIFIPVPVDMTM